MGIPANDIASHVVADNPRVLAAFRGRVRLGILPVSLLMTGRTYFLQRLDRVRLTQQCMSSRYCTCNTESTRQASTPCVLGLVAAHREAAAPASHQQQG